jgi:hypothetical protein
VAHRGRLVGAILAAALLAWLALPSVAPARPGAQPEPVFVVPGYGNDCVKQKYSSADWPGLKGKVQAGIEAARAMALASGRSVEPVPADWYVGWSFSPCDRTMAYLAKRLDAALAELQARTGQQRLDVVSFSFGGAIVRFCGTNAGGNTPRCASRMDDWVGLVNATNGSRRADLGVCGIVGWFHMWNACKAFIPGSIELRLMQARGPAPRGVESSIYWTPGDEYISPPPSSRLPGAANHRTTSPYGRVHHVQIWDPSYCPAIESLIGWDLIDAGPHVPGDTDTDCSTGPDGIRVPAAPKPPPTPATPTPAPSALS